VASEVKSLAEQTAKATDQIGAQVSSIQNSSSEAVDRDQDDIATINEMSEIASAIAGAVEEQGSATQEIARNVQQAALGTGEISSNVSGVSRPPATTGAAAHQVLQASSELSGSPRQCGATSRPSSATSRLPDPASDQPLRRCGEARFVRLLSARRSRETTDAFASADPSAAFTPIGF